VKPLPPAVRRAAFVRFQIGRIFVSHTSLLALGACLACLTLPAAAQSGDTATARAAASFNPRISLILQGTYADYSSDAEAEVPGVLLGGHSEPRPAGFSLAESELVLESNVDNLFRGWATIALENHEGETEVALEEAYANTLALPAGLGLKFGRFFSDIGYLNRVHSHAWEFVDQPLVYRALLGGNFGDDGVQLRWVAPTDLFLEVGAEALRGDGFPAGGHDRDGINSWTGFARIGGDVGAGGAWRLGVSHLNAGADGRETAEHEGEEAFAFTGDSELTIVDLVFKWAPDGNPARRNVVFNAEYFHRDEAGAVAFTDAVAPTRDSTTDYDGSQKGFYVQGIWQFMPRWRVGLRYDRLKADNTLANTVFGAGAGGDEFEHFEENDTAQRASVMVDFSNSEFSRLRLQFNRDETRPGGAGDDQVLVQYIMSIGSHAAHQF
jgi:hypothetical protein